MQKRILMLRSSIGVFGAERVILELAKGIEKSHFEPIIGVLENKNKFWAELAKTAEKSGLRTSRFGCAQPFDLKTLLQIRKYIKKNKIKLIHAHGYKANFYALMAAVCNRIPCIATCHPWTETDYSRKARLYTFLDKMWLRRMDDIVAVSDEVKEQLTFLNWQQKVDVIPNGIDWNRFNGRTDGLKVRAKVDFPDSDVVIGTIGRLVPEKGYSFLLRSARQICDSYSDTKIVFVGDGPLRRQLEQEVEELDLKSRVHFLGVRDDVPALLSRMDIFVLPSISEGIPMVLLEAMAAGKPIVATSVGAIPRIIRDRHTGLLVPPGDAETLASAIEFLLEDRRKAQDMAINARKEVQAKFSSTAMAQKYIERYDLLVSR